MTSGGELVAFTGRVVAGQAEFEGQTVDCDWLIGVDGRRLTIIYPPGWDQRYRPFRLLDGSGQVVAQEGDMLRITYMSGGSGESICPGEVQAAETVERVSPVTSPRQSAS